MKHGNRQQGCDYPATTTRIGTVAKATNAYTPLVQQQVDISIGIPEHVLEATHEAAQLMSRRLRQAQLTALGAAEAQIAAKKRFDAEIQARSQEVFSTGWHWKDPRLDIMEPPSPEAASTASHGAVSTGMSTEGRAALEGSSEAESVHSQRSSASRSMTNSEASQMKAKIYEAMAQLAKAREAARQSRDLQALESTTTSLPPEPQVDSVELQAQASTITSELERERAVWEAACCQSHDLEIPESTTTLLLPEPQVDSVELPVQASITVSSEPPREGSAWEAARLEAARALAEAPELSESKPPSAVETRDAATLRPHQAGSLGLTRHKVREQERFAAAVHLQMRAQEAMKKRVEMSEIFASKIKTPIPDETNCNV